MGCNNSSSLADPEQNLNNTSAVQQRPKQYLEILYCCSCGWVGVVRKLLLQIQKQKINIKIDCKMDSIVTNCIKVNLIRGITVVNLFKGDRQQCVKDKTELIRKIVKAVESKDQGKEGLENTASVEVDQKEKGGVPASKKKIYEEVKQQIENDVHANGQ